METYDITQEIGWSILKNKLCPKQMNGHSWRILLGLAIVFLTGAVSAIQGGFNPENILLMVIAGLTAVEHSLKGNS